MKQSQARFYIHLIYKVAPTPYFSRIAKCRDLRHSDPSNAPYLGALPLLVEIYLAATSLTNRKPAVTNVLRAVGFAKRENNA